VLLDLIGTLFQILKLCPDTCLFNTSIITVMSASDGVIIVQESELEINFLVIDHLIKGSVTVRIFPSGFSKKLFAFQGRMELQAVCIQVFLSL
jgi:hypothetical protein